MFDDEKEAGKDRGKWLGYSAVPCSNCSRVRVELWENGDRICEKCNWNQGENEFENDYREFI